MLYGSLIDTVKQTNLTMNVFASGLASAGRNGRFRMLSNRSSARVSARLSSSPTQLHLLPRHGVGLCSGGQRDGLHLHHADAARRDECPRDRLRQGSRQAWHEWMGNNVRPNSVLAGCDTSMLQRNLVLANRLNVTGAPTFFFKSGDRVTGAWRPLSSRSSSRRWNSLEVLTTKGRRFERLPFCLCGLPFGVSGGP